MLLDVITLLVDDGSTQSNGMPKIPNPMISMELHLLRVGRGGIGEFHFLPAPGRNMEMEATNMRSPKVHMYRSGGSAAARDRVSFGIIISSSFSSYQPPIGLLLHKQKKKEVSQRVSSFEWVMIRRNLNLSLRRFGADNKGIPELLLLLRDSKKQQQHHHHHRVGCAGEESSTEMGDEDVKLKKQEDESIEEDKKKKIKQGEEKDLAGSPLKSSASVPEPPSPPEKPLPGDCCGNGCIPCVWDTYNEELEDYNNLLKAYNSQFKP